jgi:hypothetical protein
VVERKTDWHHAQNCSGQAGGFALFCLVEMLNYCARDGWRKRRFCYICEGAAAGRPLPATLAWWILWRGVNYSSLCRGCSLNFLKVRGVEEVIYGAGRHLPLAARVLISRRVNCGEDRCGCC